MKQSNKLIIGGARSGKSHFAQEIAARSGKAVLFVATAEAGDEEMKRRIEAHKKSRPPEWKTIEAATQTGAEIKKTLGGAQVVIVDCITLLINNIFSRHTDKNGELSNTPGLENEVDSEINELIESMTEGKASFIIVTNEVGMDLVPVNNLARLYRDLLGRANQQLARHVDEVYLMVAGLPVQIKPSKHTLS